MVYKKSVFIPIDIENQFVYSISVLQKVWADNKVNFSYSGPKLLESSADFLKNGDAMKAALRDAVRHRVLRASSSAHESSSGAGKQDA